MMLILSLNDNHDNHDNNVDNHDTDNPILRDKEELATIESIDSGAVYTLALKTHIGMSIATWRYFAGWWDNWHENYDQNDDNVMII